jgi:hypothetical protein
MFGANPTHGGCIMVWVCLSSARTREIFRIKINKIEQSEGKILEENLGDKFTFKQDNNLKHKAKYPLELLIKMPLNVPEWPSYSFGLKIYGKI